MSGQTTQRYHRKINQIKAILSLLLTEVDEAEKYRTRAGIEYQDVLELDRVIAHLRPAYGVLVADEDISTEDVLSMANCNEEA